MMDDDAPAENSVTNAVLRALGDQGGLTRDQLKQAVWRARPDVKGASIRTMIGRMLERQDIRIDEDARYWAVGDQKDEQEI